MTSENLTVSVTDKGETYPNPAERYWICTPYVIVAKVPSKDTADRIVEQMKLAFNRGRYAQQDDIKRALGIELPDGR